MFAMHHVKFLICENLLGIKTDSDFDYNADYYFSVIHWLIRAWWYLILKKVHSGIGHIDIPDLLQYNMNLPWSN